MSAHTLQTQAPTLNYLEDIKHKAPGKALTDIFTQLEQQQEPEIIPVFMDDKVKTKAL